MPSDNEVEGFKRAARRWHTESVGTQLLRALAEAEERDAAVAKRAFRIEIPAVSIQSGVTHGIHVNVTQQLELLCLELNPTGLSNLTCKRLHVGSLIVVEGAPLELLNRAWLSRFLLVPGVGLNMEVHNRCGADIVLQGCVVGVAREKDPIPFGNAPPY